VKVAEQKEQRAEKKQAKRAAREAEGGELLDRFRRRRDSVDDEPENE